MIHTITAALKGVAIGDAFGVGIEFKSRPWIREHVHFDRFINVWNGGKNNILPGTYSDDTEHTAGLVMALLSNEPFSESLLLEKWRNEYKTDKRVKGYPRDGHGSIEKWYTGLKSIEEVREAQALREDPGNGPVMRAVPLAFVAESNLHSYAIINANATHPNENARRASYLTALTAFHFLRNHGDRHNLIKWLLSVSDDSHTIDSLKQIDALPAPHDLNDGDYLLLHGPQPLPHIPWDNNIIGLPCAAFKTALNVVYVLKHSTTTFEALKNSINMGGDIDSLAAVCTGIAGGTYGLDTLPSFLTTQTEGLERMGLLAKELNVKFFRQT